MLQIRSFNFVQKRFCQQIAIKRNLIKELNEASKIPKNNKIKYSIYVCD